MVSVDSTSATSIHPVIASVELFQVSAFMLVNSTFKGCMMYSQFMLVLQLVLYCLQ